MLALPMMGQMPQLGWSPGKFLRVKPQGTLGTEKPEWSWT